MVTGVMMKDELEWPDHSMHNVSVRINRSLDTLYFWFKTGWLPVAATDPHRKIYSNRQVKLLEDFNECLLDHFGKLDRNELARRDSEKLHEEW